MSEAQSVINKFYLKKSEPKPQESYEEVQPFIPEPVQERMPLSLQVSRECPRTGKVLRRSGVADLAQYLEAWYDNRGQAVQLDGSSFYRSNPAPWVYFNYKGGVYKLAGDTKERAVKSFLHLFQNSVDPERVFGHAIGKNGNPVLRLAGRMRAEGWYCTVY